MAPLLFLLLALAANPSLGHWVLNSPPSLGFDDATEASPPCGGMDPTNRTTVTEWPIGGYPVSLITTHPTAMWTFRAADAAMPNMWMDLQANVTQNGLGHVCYSSVPGMEMLIGKDAVVQMIQTAVDGALYQCAAVKFVKGSAKAVPSDCTNSSGVTASFMGSSSGMTGGMGDMPGMNGSGSGTSNSGTAKSGSSRLIDGQNLFTLLGAAGFATALLFLPSA